MYRYLAVILVFLAACSTPQGPVVTPLPTPTPEIEVDLRTQAVTTGSYPIATSSDDAEQQGSTVFTAHQELEMVAEAGVNQTVGYRFVGLDNIPQNATITDVRLRLTAAVSNSGTTNLRVYSQQSAGPVYTFSSAANNLTSRPLSPSSVAWTPGAWTAGTKYDTPNLVTPFVEGRNSLGEVVFIVKGTGLRQARSTDLSYADGARLRVTYSTPDVPPAGNYSTVPRATVTTLRDSFGVGVAPGYNDTANNPTSRLLTYLVDLGIPRIRGAFTRSPQPYYVQFYRDAAAAGIKTNLIVGDPTGRDGKFAAGESAAFVQAAKTTWAGLYTQLEGPNEWDTQGTGWQEQLRSFYAEYRTAIRNDPTFNGITFYGGSMAQGFNFQSYIDNNQEGAVLHPYPGGEMPEAGFLPQQRDWARNSAGAGKPVIATEMGYNNAVNSTGTGNIGVPEDIDAHYLVREFIYNYNEGISQNYKYVMFDMKPNNPERTNIEAWFGLVAVEGNPQQPLETWTLRKKPSYFATERLLDWLKDSGTGVAPTSLPFRITAPSNAVVVPLSRRDGSYDVAVWLKNELYEVGGTMDNPSARFYRPDTSAQVTLEFNTVSDVDSFRPSVNSNLVDLGADSTSVNVTVDGKVTFFRVRP